MNRNVNDYFSKTPTPHYPRNKFDFGIHKRLQTQEHGRLYPFYCRMVYPGDTWQMDLSTFVRADTSLRVPLDDIYLDTYFFFVPLRILGESFERAMGDVDSYDDTDWHFPYITIPGGETDSQKTIDCVLNYLNYSQSQSQVDNDGTFTYYYADKISAYPLKAYYKIWNDWFRDENLDPEIPIDDIDDASLNTLTSNALFELVDCKRVNKFHDYFTSGVISPSKGAAAVTIPLGLTAPVVTGDTNHASIYPLYFGAQNGTTAKSGAHNMFTAGGEVRLDGPDATYDPSDNMRAVPLNLQTDLSKAAGTINELYLAMALNSYYNKRARFGTRYIEQIRGQWGIDVPDSFFQRPEYLGGSRTTLNMVPVLSTENSSQLGQMSGNSATLTGGVNFSKTFIEYGLLIGLSCTRVKHSYTQGKAKDIWQIFDPLDLYNPVFANIGFEPIYQYELFNQGTTNPTTVFNYQEAWANLRCDVDSFAGKFGIFSNNTEIQNKWHYGDYYASGPTFSAAWLKEPRNNVSRTMTGQLIAGAGTTEASTASTHQFMFGYYFHPRVTRILPSHSLPPEITGRI